MAEKYLNTRILLKYDTFENWQASKGILKPGEVAVCTVATTPTKDVNSVAAPQILFKVGDGEHAFANLPWASGLAADVYSWAKKATPDIADFKSIMPVDTNTTYQIIKGSKTGLFKLQKQEKGSDQWTDVGNEFGTDEGAIKELITAAQTKANNAYALAEGKADKATTLSGYGITDAKIEGGVITLGNQKITPITDISSKADKTAAIGTVEAGATADKIVVKSVDGSTINKTITVNNVANTTNVSTNINGHAITSIFEGDGVTAKAATKATQDGNGKNIASTYATITTVNGKLGKTEQAADSLKLEGKSKAEVIAEAREGYATETYVNSAVAGAVQYYGVVNSEADLGKDMASSVSPKPAAKVGKGDFYRVGTAFGGLQIGDLLIAKADQASYTKVANYDRVAQENYKGTVTSITVTGNNGLTGTGTVSSSGTITLSHADTSKQVSSTNSGRTYIQSVELDEYGHVTNLATATETVEDTNTAHTHTAGEGLKITGNGGINGTVDYAVDFDVVAKKADLPAVNNGTFTVKGDGTSITGTGSMTANQAGSSEATLTVADYSNIITAKNANETKANAGNLVTEGGDTIFFCCGSSKF